MSDNDKSRQRDISPRADICLLNNEKTFKLACRAILAHAKSLYLFNIPEFFQKFHFFSELADGDIYSHRYVSPRSQFGLR